MRGNIKNRGKKKEEREREDLQREREHGERRFLRNGYFFCFQLFIYSFIESKKREGIVRTVDR